MFSSTEGGQRYDPKWQCGQAWRSMPQNKTQRPNYFPENLLHTPLAIKSKCILLVLRLEALKSSERFVRKMSILAFSENILGVDLKPTDESLLNIPLQTKYSSDFPLPCASWFWAYISIFEWFLVFHSKCLYISSKNNPRCPYDPVTRVIDAYIEPEPNLTSNASTKAPGVNKGIFQYVVNRVTGAAG